MIAAEIANALGNAHRSGSWWRSRCPVHGSRGATLALRDGDRGLIVKCWAGCDPRDVLAELRRRGLIACETQERDRRPEPVNQARRREAEARDLAARIEAARMIWS